MAVLAWLSRGGAPGAGLWLGHWFRGAPGAEGNEAVAESAGNEAVFQGAPGSMGATFWSLGAAARPALLPGPAGGPGRARGEQVGRRAALVSGKSRIHWVWKCGLRDVWRYRVQLCP